jgi:superfamily II DNA/RNA helicase
MLLHAVIREQRTHEFRTTWASTRALTRALTAAGYTEPTEVQAQAIPAALAGQDLMVSSRTGSGKTASFMLPALTLVLKARAAKRRRAQGRYARRPPPKARAPVRQRFDAAPQAPRGPRVLVLCPTRELAMQVAKAAMDYGRHVPGLRVATIVGGVPYPARS